MAGVQRFEDLECWKAARVLVREIFILCKKDLLRKDFDLKSQIRRAALSSMNNIAEGFGRSSPKELCYFLSVASASCAEVRSMLYVFLDMHIITQEEFTKYMQQTNQTQKLTKGFLRYLQSKN